MISAAIKPASGIIGWIVYRVYSMQLRDQLRGSIPDAILGHLSNRFDIIGDIAILHLPQELLPYRMIIARTIISRRHAIRTVLLKMTKLEGGNRIAQYDVLMGSGTITTHQEYGYSYCLDVQTVFFNPCLASERKRVTAMVMPGETVIIPFCGVGPFAIPAAARGANIVAIERNPEACRWFTKNCRLNDLTDRISLISGDALFPPLQKGIQFDRAIIPTPYGRDQCLDVFVPFIREGGMIHFYTFKKKAQIEHLTRGFEQNGFDVVTKRRCGNVAPSVSRWVFDLRKAR
jgi:tRNA (guanine37-N1)-methyltransferase